RERANAQQANHWLKIGSRYISTVPILRTAAIRINLIATNSGQTSGPPGREKVGSSSTMIPTPSLVSRRNLLRVSLKWLAGRKPG
ncbi:MAG: hypothetical protein KA781_06240, partial [Aquabacterium sp.]|nr:hypothetical protein [Aquabacterium sp.]